jgi:hypothetical protein
MFVFLCKIRDFWIAYRGAHCVHVCILLLLLSRSQYVPGKGKKHERLQYHPFSWWAAQWRSQWRGSKVHAPFAVFLPRSPFFVKKSVLGHGWYLFFLSFVFPVTRIIRLCEFLSMILKRVITTFGQERLSPYRKVPKWWLICAMCMFIEGLRVERERERVCVCVCVCVCMCVTAIRIELQLMLAGFLSLPYFVIAPSLVHLQHYINTGVCVFPIRLDILRSQIKFSLLW